MYHLNSFGLIILTADNSTVPDDVESPKHQAYQAWLLEGNVPAPCEATVPRSVTMRQARLALLQAGLLTTVNEAIANMPGASGAAARIEWEYSQEVQRNKALVLALAPALNLNDAQLDELFIAAAKL